MKRYLLILCVLLLAVSTMGIGALAAEPVIANIPIAIHQEGAVPTEAEVCTVEIIPEDPGFPMPTGTENGVCQIEILSGASGSIEIPCAKVGVYDYTVRQVPGENTNCVYDNSAYQVTVFVTYSETGDMEVSIVAYRDSAPEKTGIAFLNDYAAADDVTISALKTLDGETPKDNAFSFQLADDKGNVIETVKNTGKEVTFQPLTFDRSGTFTYTIQEVKGASKNISYDTAVYQAVIEVTQNEENDYEAKLVYKKDGKAYTGTPVFANKTIPSVIPNTGDRSNVLFLGGIAILSAAALLVLLLLKRQSKEWA